MKYQGLYTAIVTPFKDGQVDYDAYKALIEAQIAGGVILILLGAKILLEHLGVLSF